VAPADDGQVLGVDTTTDLPIWRAAGGVATNVLTLVGAPAVPTWAAPSAGTISWGAIFPVSTGILVSATTVLTWGAFSSDGGGDVTATGGGAGLTLAGGVGATYLLTAMINMNKSAGGGTSRGAIFFTGINPPAAHYDINNGDTTTNIVQYVIVLAASPTALTVSVTRDGVGGTVDANPLGDGYWTAHRLV
jgi:hypothetical protein